MVYAIVRFNIIMVQIDKEKIYEKIIDTLIKNYSDGSTGIDEEITIDDTYSLYVNIDVSLSGDGYCEDDYFNGTGAYITTSVGAYVNSIEMYIYNNITEEKECDFDCYGWDWKIEKDLEDYFRS